MREAYSLLRQSIIHVEQDDINFDEEELEGERPDDARPRASDQEESQDVDMSGTGELTSDTLVHQTDESQDTSQPGAQTDDSMAGPTAVAQDHATPMQPKKKKPKMQITHDQYMTLQSLVVFHLAEHERETGQGIDRDDLVDWYLEMKEEEMEDLDALEHEKELFTKVLKKLVKVNHLSCWLYAVGLIVLLAGQDHYLIPYDGDAQESLPSEEAISAQTQAADGTSQKKVILMVHPSVDTDESSFR